MAKILFAMLAAVTVVSLAAAQPAEEAAAPRAKNPVLYVNNTTDANLKFIVVDADTTEDGGIIDVKVVSSGDTAERSLYVGERVVIVFDTTARRPVGSPLGQLIDTGSNNRRVTAMGSNGNYTVTVGAYSQEQ